MSESIFEFFGRTYPSEEDITVWLASGASINDKDKECFNRTPLHAAVAYDRASVLPWLIKAGADVNAKDDKGRTPLHLVSSRCQGIETIKLLIDAGADVNARENDGSTPLHSIACATHRQPGFVRILLEAGADVNAKNDDGYTPLMKILGKIGTFLTDVNDLIVGGADVRARNCLDMTVLHCAARESKAEIFRRVFEAGAKADVNTRCTDDGYTPLHIAAQNPHNSAKEIVHELIKGGADVNIKDNNGLTPIFHVCKGFVMEELVAAGTNANEMHPDGRSVLAYFLHDSFVPTDIPEGILALLQAGAVMILPKEYKAEPIKLLNLFSRDNLEVDKTLIRKLLRENQAKFASGVK